eukprot:GFUD01004897.1.p2 GENE.GFUD01004897.1~~GFUD01004897.1.p2  ORF type:complete len:100 (-),score=14.05 GFUD01004897.1:133-432(-)
MGGDGHGFPYKVPEWQTYKVGAHTPELQQVERMLKSLGLKDPWLRNEVWRFDQREAMVMTRRVGIKKLMTMGMLPGFAIACVTAGIHYYNESKNDHGHH